MHPHEIAQALLQDWGGLWTQDHHAKGIEVWAAIKKHAKTLSTNLDPITREDLDRGLKMLKTNTAMSPGQLRALSPEATELLLNILQDVEKTKA